MPERPISLAALAAALALAASALLTVGPGSAARPIPPPPTEKATPKGDQVAVLAGGCFWGIEGLYEHVRGVKSVTSGYAGGTEATANYRDVSSERTGHAEAVRIVYDPAQISYGQLLQIYFSVAHDPTQLNRQTPDVGPSYRSAIFPRNPAQRALAQAYIAKLTRAGAFDRPIVTTLENGTFFPAEAHHQDFMRRNPEHPYIVRWDRPKLAAFRKELPGLYRK